MRLPAWLAAQEPLEKAFEPQEGWAVKPPMVGGKGQKPCAKIIVAVLPSSVIHVGEDRFEVAEW